MAEDGQAETMAPSSPASLVPGTCPAVPAAAAAGAPGAPGANVPAAVGVGVPAVPAGVPAPAPASDGAEAPPDNESNEELVDISWIVEKAAASLTFAEPMICNKESFSLQDSMAALEVMDRTMDCCEIPASQAAPYGVEAPAGLYVSPRPTPTGLDDRVSPLPWDDLTMEDAAFIAIEMFVRLDSLVSGASVVESTFTCLYTHRPVVIDMRDKLASASSKTNNRETKNRTDSLPSASRTRNDDSPSYHARDSPDLKGSLPQRIVYTLTEMLLEQTDIFRSIVLNADIYEEEDFTVNTYNIAISSTRNEQHTLGLVRETIKHVRASDDQNAVENKMLLALLQYHIEFFTICTTLARLSGKSVREETKKAKDLAAVVIRRLDRIESLLPELTGKSTDRRKWLLKQTFDSLINRPLVGNAPVRKVMFRSWSESVDHVKTIAKHFQWALCDLLLKANSLSRIRRVLSQVSMASANILVRSLIILNLYFDDKVFGQYSLSQIIVDHIRQLSSTPDAVLMSPTMQDFLKRLAKPIYDSLKLQILNRNRQRAYMEIAILPEWGLLQQEAHIVDATYRRENGLDGSTPPYISLYVLLTTIELMDHFIVLGIEQDLFCSHHEIMVAYWYRDYLLSSQLNQLSSLRRLKQLFQEAEAKKKAQDSAKSSSSSKSRRKGGKQKRGKNSASSSAAPIVIPAPTPFEVEDEFEFILVSMKRSLCRGVVRYFAALHKAGLLKQTDFEFTTPEKLFAKRFEAFAVIQHPPPLSYGDFVQGSDFRKVAQDDLMVSATDCFNTSKATAERLIQHTKTIDGRFVPAKEEELRRLVKVSVGNAIYMQRLRQTIASPDSDGGVSVLFDFDTHKHYCTVKLK